MFPNSCSFMTNKSKSSFNATTPQGFKLRHNHDVGLVNRNASTFSDSCGFPVGLVDRKTIKQCSTNYDSSAPRTSNLMSFVCNLGGYSRMGLSLKSNNIQSFPPVKSGQSCKGFMGIGFPHHNTPPIPFVSSYLVGGFVGSKSQLSRRPAQGVEVKMWDIIRDFLSYVDNSTTSSKNKNKRSQMGKKQLDPMAEDKEHDSRPLTDCIKTSEIVGLLNKSEEMEIPYKQTYADVAKSKLGVLTVKVNCDQTSQQSTERQNNHPEKDKSKLMSVIEPIPMCSNNCLSSRQRVASECSADSDDSFIVFEYCDGDNNIVYGGDDSEDNDDASNTSDEYSLLGFDLKGEQSLKNDCDSNTPLNKSPEASVKKVRFAEGKSLKQVHTIIAWDYAYRSARRGPWEMLARDSERFKCRIVNIEAKLAPVLNQQYRQLVYQERFAS